MAFGRQIGERRARMRAKAHRRSASSRRVIHRNANTPTSTVHTPSVGGAVIPGNGHNAGRKMVI